MPGGPQCDATMSKLSSPFARSALRWPYKLLACGNSGGDLPSLVFNSGECFVTTHAPAKSAPACPAVEMAMPRQNSSVTAPARPKAPPARLFLLVDIGERFFTGEILKQHAGSVLGPSALRAMFLIDSVIRRPLDVQGGQGPRAGQIHRILNEGFVLQLLAAVFFPHASHGVQLSARQRTSDPGRATVIPDGVDD